MTNADIPINLEQVAIDLVNIYNLLPQDLPSTKAFEPVYDKAVHALLLIEEHKLTHTSAFDWWETFTKE